MNKESPSDNVILMDSAAFPADDPTNPTANAMMVVDLDDAAANATTSMTLDASPPSDLAERRATFGDLVKKNSVVLKKIYGDISHLRFSRRVRLRFILSGQAIDELDRMVSLLYRSFEVLLIIFSTVLFIATTMPQLYEPSANQQQQQQWSFVCETVIVAFFTFDFCLRIFTASSLRDFCSLLTFFDFISFIGYYIELIIVAADAAPSNTLELAMLRMLRLLRLARLFKLTRSVSGGIWLLAQVLNRSKDGLFLLVVLCSIATVVFASVTYYIEIVSCSFDYQRELWIRESGDVSPFQSIPDTFWFIAVSITTVGYGSEVPVTLGGRAWVCIVMLFGVLVLSFPNILIGSNFAEVHHKVSNERAQRQLGRYFRRVRTVVRFIRMWREFRVKGRLVFDDELRNEAPQRQRYRPTKMHNFMYRMSEFPDRQLYDTPEKVAACRLEDVVHHDLTLLSVLQRLLEGFSGCASVEELTQAYHFFPDAGTRRESITNATVFELVLRAGATHLSGVFVVGRELETALVNLTKRGVDCLQNYVESNVMPCMRCYAEAKEFWVATTRTPAVDFLPIDGYRNWQSIQSKVPKRHAADFSYDLKKPSARSADIYEGMVPREVASTATQCSCRYCNYMWGFDAAVRPDSDFCFDPDEEFLEMQIAYAQNALKIAQLESKLQHAAVDRRALLSSAKSKTRPPRSPSVAVIVPILPPPKIPTQPTLPPQDSCSGSSGSNDLTSAQTKASPH